MMDLPPIENPLGIAKVEASILQNAQPLWLVPFKHRCM